MAYIYFKCSCNKSLAVDERGVGLAIKCSDCGAQVTVPEWEYEFVCSKCDTTFGAAAGIANDSVQCVTCGNKFIVPTHNDLELDSITEQTDAPVHEVQYADSGDEQSSEPPQAVPARKRFLPTINWARFPNILYRFTSIVVVIFIAVTGSSWLISKIRQSNDGLNIAIQRSRDQGDLFTANTVLEKAIQQYPLAFSHARQAKKLLADNQARLNDTTNLVTVMALTKADNDYARSVVLLTKAIRKYSQATNLADAETLLKTVQDQMNDSWMLSAALVNAQANEDASARIQLLEDALGECPCATNRADAEAMIATARKQLKETEGLDQAVSQAQREGTPAVRAKLLAAALAKYPEAANRGVALGLLNSLQTRAEGQVTDPLLKAIAVAKQQDTFVSAIQVLKDALKANPDSPCRVEAEKVLALYQKRLLEAAALQKPVLTNDLEEITDLAISNGYVFLPPSKALTGAGGILVLYDSPFVNKISAMNYGLEVRLRKPAGPNDKAGNGVPLAADSLRYVPRLIISAKGEAMPRGSIVVVEYYLDDHNDKAPAQRTTVERIPCPAISKGQTIAVDCRGIECGQAKKAVALKKTADERWHGVIVSIYGPGRELLLQKCSTAKLVKECSLQAY